MLYDDERKTAMETRNFPLRVILTVLTGRLLTESKGPRDNGIGDLYEILEFMTGDAPYTHQLGRFSEECKPHLLRQMPLEVKAVSGSLDSLDRWLLNDCSDGSEGVKMWLTECKMMFPQLQDSYPVTAIPAEGHVSRNPLEELAEMRPDMETIVITV